METPEIADNGDQDIKDLNDLIEVIDIMVQRNTRIACFIIAQNETNEAI